MPSPPLHCSNKVGKNMEKLPTQKVVCSFFIAFFLLSYSTTSQEVEDEREFNYDRNSLKGPYNWGEIRPEWRMCSNGTMQSPIDMLDERVKVVSHLGILKRDYHPSNATLVNRGHDISLKWGGGAGYIEINGTRYDLEFHMVHESKDQRVAVIGIIFKIGRSDPFLSEMKDHIEAVADTGEEERVVGMVDPKHIRIGNRNSKYYRYIGSLTIPPCTQDVVWTILSKVRTVSREQLSLLRDAVHDDSESNARPLQPINQRPVKLYRPQDHED
ncbi:hypothetical protein RHSIM_Rhsim01G0215100 [Rhododendron simsii]|uniref:Alpha-carbonic anhydrase domain-containing protein n=1 Tax=Rhododendron simsii TaxID=118357 RepID=A0A834HJV5_RHOSS|nr:hypothetical protein RHSIM_Rhsim01G0215100 [Rhododendron simsii]